MAIKSVRLFYGMQHDFTKTGTFSGMEDLLNFQDGNIIAALWASTSTICRTDRKQLLLLLRNQLSVFLSRFHDEMEHLDRGDSMSFCIILAVNSSGLRCRCILVLPTSVFYFILS